MTTVVRSPVFAVGVAAGVTFGAAELIGSGEPWRVIMSAGIPIVYAAVVAIVGRRRDTLSVLAGRPIDERAGRRDTLSVLAGRPIDERAEHVSQEASAWAFGLTAIVVVAAVAWQIAIGGAWTGYAAIAVIMAVAYLGSLFVLQARH